MTLRSSSTEKDLSDPFTAAKFLGVPCLSDISQLAGDGSDIVRVFCKFRASVFVFFDMLALATDHFSRWRQSPVAYMRFFMFDATSTNVSLLFPHDSHAPSIKGTIRY